MGKQHTKGVPAPRIILLKCPGCGAIHTATEWHDQSLKRWRTVRKLPANKENHWFECPTCKEAFKGTELTPVIKKEGKVVAEGWFAFYHTPYERRAEENVESRMSTLSQN